MDLGQQVYDMLIKELFNLKPGTFIKGIRFLNMSVLEGRSATLNVNGWCSDIIDSKYNEKYMVRTPWYTNPTFDLLNGNQALEAIKAFKVPDFDECIDIEDGLEERFASMGWAHFEYNQPLGIHLGAFAVFGGITEPDQILIYTKILRGDGEVGYIACSTQSINNKHLELL